VTEFLQCAGLTRTAHLLEAEANALDDPKLSRSDLCSHLNLDAPAEGQSILEALLRLHIGTHTASTDSGTAQKLQPVKTKPAINCTSLVVPAGDAGSPDTAGIPAFGGDVQPAIEDQYADEIASSNSFEVLQAAEAAAPAAAQYQFTQSFIQPGAESMVRPSCERICRATAKARRLGS
jgi:hypothetical protein